MSAVEKLQELINEIDVLIGNCVTSKDDNFRNWKDSLMYFLINNFGKESDEYSSIKSMSFGVFQSFSNAMAAYNNSNVRYSQYDLIEACRKDLARCKNLLNLYLSKLQEKEEIKKQENNFMSSQKETELSYQKVFIVHGHDGELKYRVARLIEKQGIEAIILDEQVNAGRTIIEKFEENSDVGGAICLFTADDIGRKKDETGEEKYRPRQNVVFEAGYFMGKLGRNHVVIIADNEVEFPSDLLGIVYINSENLDVKVLEALDNMGYSIDMNKLLKKS